MTGTHNIEDTKKAVSLVGKGLVAYDLISADGKVDWDDLSHLMVLYPILKQLPNFADIPKEIGDLQDAEVAELIAHVGVELGGVQDVKTRMIVERSLKLIAAGVQLVEAIQYRAPALVVA